MHSSVLRDLNCPLHIGVYILSGISRENCQSGISLINDGLIVPNIREDCQAMTSLVGVSNFSTETISVHAVTGVIQLG